MSDSTRSVPLTTYYLEMLRRDELRPKRAGPDFRVVRVEVPCPEFNRFLYSAVGWQWSWIDKLTWDYEQWRRQVDHPGFGTWVAYQSGTPAGYYELEQQPEGDVEIVYFGLLPQFTGQGLGGPLLTSAVESAWDWGARRVWVHTCSLDHPAALANYLARGFRQFMEEHSHKQIPATPGRDWP
jgi:GNAT superfamily N-acetyltransferase